MHFVQAKGLVSAENGMNLYRGCTHGCIYCDSRSRCYHMDHLFEDVEVKENAPALLEDTLRRRRSPCIIGTGAMCDPYMHCEEKLQLTRQCLELIEKYGFGVTIQTKSCRILRDRELLGAIHGKAKAVVQMTLTTYDEDLCRILEPAVSTTYERYMALKAFQQDNIPTVVWLSPVLTFLNDTEENLRGILDYCFDAGVKGIICYGMGVTLREGSREHFYTALDRHFPGLKERYIHTFGKSYECTSSHNDRLMGLFHDLCEKHGVLHDNEAIFDYMHTFPQPEQLSMLDTL